MIKPVTDLVGKKLQNKKVLLRVDFNVPVENGKISESYRITAVKETIDYLASRGAIVALLSHITGIDSFEMIFSEIKEKLGRELKFISDCVGSDVKDNLSQAKVGDIFLLENVRKHEGEEKNDEKFAKKLAEPFDIYVNDAFAVSHRSHASVSAITKFLSSYGGLLLMKEVENLTKAIKTSKERKTLILGGAKVESKLPVIENFISRTDNILIGGVVANVFLKASGVDIKKSLIDSNFLKDAKNLLKEKNLVIPEDYVISNDMILDIGQKTIDKFIKTISESRMVIWNGPLGKSEVEQFSQGTKEIAKAIINSTTFSIVGGGDTIAFLEKINILDKFNYVSTGGGAMLEFLAGKALLGLIALGY